MKTPKNLRIILFPIGGTLERDDAESIENDEFKKETLAKELAKALNCPIANISSPWIKTAKSKKEIVPIGDSAIVMTADDFFDTQSKKVRASFEKAIENIGKENCYSLSDFSIDYNDEIFGGKTGNYWMTYIKLK